jgi:hypothetical protein
MLVEKLEIDAVATATENAELVTTCRTVVGT